jgi:hypothetical protein
VSGGHAVDTEQLRAHARNVEALAARFEAVRSASAHIARDESAYGLLCGWIAGVLEGRHARQVELIAYVEENLSMVAERLRGTADRYDAVETDTGAMIRTVGGRSGS